MGLDPERVRIPLALPLAKLRMSCCAVCPRSGAWWQAMVVAERVAWVQYVAYVGSGMALVVVEGVGRDHEWWCPEEVLRQWCRKWSEEVVNIRNTIT